MNNKAPTLNVDTVHPCLKQSNFLQILLWLHDKNPHIPRMFDFIFLCRLYLWMTHIHTMKYSPLWLLMTQCPALYSPLFTSLLQDSTHPYSVKSLSAHVPQGHTRSPVFLATQMQRLAKLNKDNIVFLVWI